MKNTFGDPIIDMNLALEEDIAPGSTLLVQRGMNYNQFLEDHVALRQADMDKIQTVWNPSVIMYADGTVDRMEGAE